MVLNNLKILIRIPYEDDILKKNDINIKILYNNNENIF